MTENHLPTPEYSLDQQSGAVTLHTPERLPQASGYLWNHKMMLHLNCRGFASSIFMQPEPAKYSSHPSLEATTFLQPEHHYYANHPSRFFYIRDLDSAKVYILPLDIVRSTEDNGRFIVSRDQITWHWHQDDLRAELEVSLDQDKVAEHWSLNITNAGVRSRRLQLTANFSVGFQSWMYQSADYCEDIRGLVVTKITPYQKLEDYYRNQQLAEMIYLTANKQASSWTSTQQSFEGFGGPLTPDSIALDALPCERARYQVPTAAMQFLFSLEAEQTEDFQFVFGAAKQRDDILVAESNPHVVSDHKREDKQHFQLHSPDSELNHFVNFWLPNQIVYQGETHRLTTDPQTRNYLQDSLGMLYIRPEHFRNTLVLALSQQASDGEMPDGVLLNEQAQLKYINQVPHADHGVWLPICLAAYLDETNDGNLLESLLPFSDQEEMVSVAEHINRAMLWLENNLDERDLSLIHQGDWCDPMNMAGHKGKGVSIWLTMATCWAVSLWADTIEQFQLDFNSEYWRNLSARLRAAIETWGWGERWYIRGITDDGRSFGHYAEREGRMYLNPQSWAMLCGAADQVKVKTLVQAVREQLGSPYGVMMLSPAYTQMQTDIGRLTQKFPGVAENGSVYNHAAAFYAYALYVNGQVSEGFETLKSMLVNHTSCGVRQQLPTFIPNYYRGAYHQFPDMAGRSSQLFHTGTVSWFYRTIIEQLCGMKGCNYGLKILPNLPSAWQDCRFAKQFRGARVEVSVRRNAMSDVPRMWVDGERVEDCILRDPQPGKTYNVVMEIPKSE